MLTVSMKVGSFHPLCGEYLRKPNTHNVQSSNWFLWHMDAHTSLLFWSGSVCSRSKYLKIMFWIERCSAMQQSSPVSPMFPCDVGSPGKLHAPTRGFALYVCVLTELRKLPSDDSLRRSPSTTVRPCTLSARASCVLSAVKGAGRGPYAWVCTKLLMSKVALHIPCLRFGLSKRSSLRFKVLTSHTDTHVRTQHARTHARFTA